MIRIRIVTPAAAGSRKGNRATALRWAGIFRRLGHRPRLAADEGDATADLFVVLHALKSADVLRRLRDRAPTTPVVLALTGTDLYRDLERSERARGSLGLASRIVVLHPLAVEDVPAAYRDLVRPIVQSARPLPDAPVRSVETFDVAVIGHLREVKDPFLPARAARLLPEDSRLRIRHAGAALTPEMEQAAREEERDNPRYRWLSNLRRITTLRLLASSRLFVLPSRLEGAANTLSEAIAAGTPAVLSRVRGNVGIVGEDWPALFDVGDVRGLADLLRRAETDSAWYADLVRRTKALAPLVDPSREREAWSRLLSELAIASP